MPNARARAAADERKRPKSEKAPPRAPPMIEPEGEASGGARAHPLSRATRQGEPPQKKEGKGERNKCIGAPNQCAARRASEASAYPEVFILILSVFFLVDSVIIHVVDFFPLSVSGAPRRGARPRGRAFRPRVREVISFVYRRFSHHFIVLGIVIPLRYYCTAVFCGQNG